MKTYTSDHYDQLLASGEVVLAQGWGGPVARAMEQIVRPSGMCVLKEGGTIWADCLVILNPLLRRNSPFGSLIFCSIRRWRRARLNVFYSPHPPGPLEAW